MTDWPRRQDHLQITNVLRDRTQNATQLQQQLFHATGVRVTITYPLTARVVGAPLMTSQPVSCSSSDSATECQQSPGKKGPLEADCRTTVVRYVLKRVEIRPQLSWWAAKGLASNRGALPASSYDRTRPLWRLKCHGLGRDHQDWENRTPHMPRECRWALLQRQCHWAHCCALRPSAWEGIHLSWRQCKSPSCVCCPRSHTVSRNYDSAVASEVPRLLSGWTFVGHPPEACPETASQTTGHQRARWCTPGGMAPDPLSGSSGEWGVAV